MYLEVYTRICYIILSFIFYMPFIVSLNNKHLKVTRSGVAELSTCSVGLQFFVEVSNLSDDEDFDVSAVPEKCCLKLGEDVDCGVMAILGECNENVARGSSKTLKVVAPLIDSLNRHGYCLVNIDSKPSEGHRKVMRDPLKINFDTRLENAETIANLKENIQPCKNIDEDPLNDCKQVDCDVFYNDKRSYYDKVLKRCVRPAKCINKDNNEDVVYDPKSNTCTELVSDDDLDFLKTLSPRPAKDIVIISETHRNDRKNASMKGHKAFKHIVTTPLVSHKHNDAPKPIPTTNFIKYLHRYVSCSYIVLIAVILTQCCLIFFLIYYLKLRKKPEKEVVSKYFNYRQDVSVTTPLIPTSNVDTETTDKFFYESSNVDNKIKCYKACHQDKDVTMSLSDDILSKCLNRRDWSPKPAKSDTVTNDNVKNEIDIEKLQEKKETLKQPQIKVLKIVDHTPKANSNSLNDTDEKVTIESETNTKKSGNSCRKIFNKIRRSNEKPGTNLKKDSLSEKELQCHNYNDQINPTNNQNPVKIHSSTKLYNFFTLNRKTEPSVEKEAQVELTNDSIDDLLASNFSSMDIMSQNCLSQVNPAMKMYDDKRHILRKVFSIISRRSAKPCSDPGMGKDNAESISNLDLEFLHFANNPSESSSNNRMEVLKNVDFTYSRSSF